MRGDYLNKAKAILFSIIVFIVTFTIRYYIFHFRGFAGPGDFWGSLVMARNVLQGLDPYTGAHDSTYPFTAGLIALPFTPLADRLAGAVYFSLISAILAGALIFHTGQLWRLLMFFSVPFVYAMEWTQWSPLITAAWFIPALAPLMVIIKPQIALPIFLNRFRKAGFGYIAAVIVLVVSLTISPGWPIHWWNLAKGYQYYIPLLMPGGFLLPLAVLNISDKCARLLLAMSILPFCTRYDLLPLFIIPETPLQMIFLRNNLACTNECRDVVLGRVNIYTSGS